MIYSCHACNLKKGAAVLPPTALTIETVQVRLDGRLIGLTADAERLIDALALNSPEWMDWRLSWMRIVDLAAEHDEDLYQRLMGYPDDLPDLASLRPPANTRPDGVEQSHFVRQERGELSDTYIN